MLASAISPSQQSWDSRLKGLFLQHPCPCLSMMCPPQQSWYIFVKTTGMSRLTTLQHPLVSRSYGFAPQHAFGWWTRSTGRVPLFGGAKMNVKNFVLANSVKNKKQYFLNRISTGEMELRLEGGVVYGSEPG